MGGIAYGLGDWWRKLNERTNGAPSPAARYSPGIGDSVTQGLTDFGTSFDAGLRGTPQGASGPVGLDGVPEYLRDPAIEGQRSALRNMVGGQTAANPTPAMNVESGLSSGESSGIDVDAAAAALARGLKRREMTAPSQVKVSIGGKEFDYSNGRAGGAPTLGGIGNGLGKQWGTEPSDQTLEYSQPGIGRGSFSQMNPLDQSMKSLQQVQDEKALADAQPAPEGGLIGANIAEQRRIEAEIARKQADEYAKIQSEIAIAKGKAGVQDAQQGRRRDDYSSAVLGAEQKYNAYLAELNAQPLPPEEKERLKGEAANRYATEQQRIKDSFGIGANMAGIVSSSDNYSR